jgi:Flp pilus assembly protein CpaB
VKRQTLTLVVIGLLLFIAGGGIAFETVEHGSKTHSGGSTTPTIPVTVPAVVVTQNVSAGTTGADLVSEGLVKLQLIPQNKYVSTDLPNLSGLASQVLTASLTKGEAIQTTQLTASTSVIAVPAGEQAVSIATTGVAGLAGYLRAGDHVDIYANITKPSMTQSGSPQSLPVGITIPCTQLAMSDIQVLDVSDIVPALGSKANSTGRVIPASLTLLVAVSPAQSQEITFLSQNETLSVVQTQSGVASPAPGVCYGTGQYTALP